MSYMIKFYTRYWEQLAEVWQGEFGEPLNVTEQGCIITMRFWDDAKRYEDSRAWLGHLEAAGFVRHVEYSEREEASF